MIRAAGILFVTPEGRTLLLQRAAPGDHAGEWALPGGKVEDGETAEDAARRETREETGIEYDGRLVLWTRRQKDGVDFSTYFAPVEREAAIAISEESSAFQWLSFADAAALPDLHPGMAVVLARPGMDELDLGIAIRDGELVSPQRYGNLTLFAMRITGTGKAERPQLDESTWRDPSYYLNEHFLARCNGLPAIWNHQKTGEPLDGGELSKRIVGTFFLPWVRSDEVWGIAKVYNQAAADTLTRWKLSTSPFVMVGGDGGGMKFPLAGGKHLLLEGEPTLLDSVAICPLGVWDKGDEPEGIESVDAQPDTRIEDAAKAMRASYIDSLVRRLNA